MDKLGNESGNTRQTGSEAETATIERWGHWRDRARGTRAHADRETDPNAKRILLTVADSYERLARRLEERSRIMGKRA
jgi:hypothetical protein